MASLETLGIDNLLELRQRKALPVSYLEYHFLKVRNGSWGKANCLYQKGIICDEK